MNASKALDSFRRWLVYRGRKGAGKDEMQTSQILGQARRSPSDRSRFKYRASRVW